MYVCVCQAVTDGEIREAAAEGRVRTLPDLREQLGVASRCGRCAPCAMAVLAECRRDCDATDCPRKKKTGRSRSRSSNRTLS